MRSYMLLVGEVVACFWALLGPFLLYFDEIRSEIKREYYTGKSHLGQCENVDVGEFALFLDFGEEGVCMFDVFLEEA